MEKTTNNYNSGESINIEESHTRKKAQGKNPGDCPELNPLDSMENNHKLPAEILAEVFSYLTHTEKLISRLVCTDWNREISSILAKCSYFTLTTAASHETILDSEVPWTKIKISDSPGFTLPTKAASFVTTIVLEVSGSDKIQIMRILTRFPQLIDLDVSILGGNLIELENSGLTYERLDALRNQFRDRVGKIQNLTITFPFRKYITLLESLNSFSTESLCLVKFALRERRPPWPFSPVGGENISQYCSMTDVINTISKSSRTLKYLEFDFVTKIRNKFTDLISKLTTLEDLKLESFLLHSDPTEGMLETDFQIHQSFLKTQVAKGFMKSLSLPWCSNASFCQDFIRCLPDNIKFVGNVRKEHVTDEFYSTFSKCESMALHSRNLSMFNHPCPSIRQFHYCVMVNADPNELTWDIGFYKTLGSSLLNVVEFYVVQSNMTAFCDFSLDLVIENFQQLRILEIHSGVTIFNPVVCGLDEDYTDELRRTKQLYLMPNVPEGNRDGLPLSSLKHLEKLILLGTCISDLGIYYGLRFGSTLKHMTFETEAKISDWGLHWLGAGNPGLESFDCSFKTGEVSSDGPENLRKQFPMLEATGKFKLVKKP